jgi:transposase
MRRGNRKVRSATGLPVVHEHAAGVDIGAREIFVAVPGERDPEPIRSYPTFTGDLHQLADWLVVCRITTVAMEATGVYWIPLYQILEERGLEVCLVNARHFQNVPGRRSNCMLWDCCGARTGRRQRFARCDRSGDTGRVWCRWPACMCSTCRRRWIR